MTTFYLGGGWNADKGQEALQTTHQLAETIFKKENTKQVLHIPFARIGIMKESRSAFLPHNFKPIVEHMGIQYLNGMFWEDIEKFNGDTIYINGGNNCEFLLAQCKQPKLLEAIQKARVIVGESCGSMIMGSYYENSTNEEAFASGLGYIENAIIISHYNNIGAKESELKSNIQNKAITGIGIDEDTFIQYKDGIYGDIIGNGNITHIS